MYILKLLEILRNTENISYATIFFIFQQATVFRFFYPRFLQLQKPTKMDQTTAFMDIGTELNFEQLPPELLNEKNKQLSQSIKEQEIKLKETEKQYELQKERMAVLQDHLKNIQVEIQTTQEKITVKNKEIEAEDHVRQLYEREIGRLTNDSKLCEKKYAEYQEQVRIGCIAYNICRLMHCKMIFFVPMKSWTSSKHK